MLIPLPIQLPFKTKCDRKKPIAFLISAEKDTSNEEKIYEYKQYIPKSTFNEDVTILHLIGIQRINKFLFALQKLTRINA